MSATDSNSPGNGKDASRSAACLKCRKSKVKCIRSPGLTVCKRCDSTGKGNECVIPEYHVGRYKGVPNKRHGLEKAIYQVEQALKRSKSNGVAFDQDTDVDLRQLIDKSHTLTGSTGVSVLILTRLVSSISPLFHLCFISCLPLSHLK